MSFVFGGTAIVFISALCTVCVFIKTYDIMLHMSSWPTFLKGNGAEMNVTGVYFAE